MLPKPWLLGFSTPPALGTPWWGLRGPCFGSLLLRCREPPDHASYSFPNGRGLFNDAPPPHSGPDAAGAAKRAPRPLGAQHGLLFSFQFEIVSEPAPGCQRFQIPSPSPTNSSSSASRILGWDRTTSMKGQEAQRSHLLQIQPRRARSRGFQNTSGDHKVHNWSGGFSTFPDTCTAL